jgi:hypothetical protein
MCTLRDPSRDRTQKEEYLSGDHLALSVAADSDSGAAKADFESLNSAELGEYFPPNSSDDVVRCGWLLTEQSTRTPTTATCRLVGGRRTPGGWRCRATVTGKPTCTTRRGPRLTSDDHPCPQRRGNIRLVWPPNHVRSDQWSDPGRVWDQPSGPGPPLGRGSLHRSTKPPRDGPDPRLARRVANQHISRRSPRPQSHSVSALLPHPDPIRTTAHRRGQGTLNDHRVRRRPRTPTLNRGLAAPRA